MNRTVKYHLKRLSRKGFGYILIHTFEEAPEAYRKSRSFHDQKKKLADPVELVKYGIRIHPKALAGDDDISLKDLQQKIDPLEVIEFWKFCNQFTYSEDKTAFVPQGKMIKGTSKMKAIWDKVEQRRVEKAWEEAREHLTAPGGGAAELLY